MSPPHISSYLPRYLARRLGASGPPREPSAARLPAAILMADVAGFTRLSEDLSRLGPAGAEQLSAALNAYFGQLIEIIDAHGGDVLRFAGDAPIVLFPAEEGLSAATHRAAACALALQGALHDYEVAPALRLSMRICLSTGTAVAAVVGGIGGRWELLVGGPPLSALQKLAPLGEPGSVLASEEAWAALFSLCQGAPFPRAPGVHRIQRLLRPAPPPPAQAAAPGDLATLSPLVPHNVLRLVETGDTWLSAESRLVTALFLAIEGVVIEGPEVLPTLQGALVAVQSAVYRFEGSLNQFLVDDKGLTVLALWGVPLRTHEDDADRAVRAALEAESSLRALGLRCAAGLSSGRVFCGHRGSAARREYAVIGASINLAARLMGKAQGLA